MRLELTEAEIKAAIANWIQLEKPDFGVDPNKATIDFYKDSQSGEYTAHVIQTFESNTHPYR